MGVRGAICAVVLGGLVFIAPSQAVRSGCNPNLAWQDRHPSWGAGTIAYERESVGCGGAPELVVVTTTGDARPDTPIHDLGGTGVFVKEVEQALLDGAADLAVHSAKDLPAGDEHSADECPSHVHAHVGSAHDAAADAVTVSSRSGGTLTIGLRAASKLLVEVEAQ